MTDQRLSKRLRTETKDLHTAAERSGVMRTLARGQLTRRGYVALLANLAEIYRALETELSRHGDRPAVAWLDLDALRRLERLEADIAAWHRADDAAPIIELTARDYAARLHHTGDECPDLLVAHAYVRYLGDLSGGQILRPIAARMLGASDGRGLSFYDFPRVSDAGAFKQRFRARLDAIQDGDLCDRIVAEAKLAFALHERLFRELERPE